MKEHAKKALKHDVEVLGKTVPTIAVVALFLIGSGSAAVLTEFGTVTGTADVENQALTVSNTDTSQTYNGDAAPLTDGTVVEITNNNDNRFVDYQWATRESDNFKDFENAYREVYEVQSFEAEPVASSEDDVEANDVDITVTPNVDEVKYTLELPTESSYDYTNGAVTLQLSRKNADNYQVGYYPANKGWFVKSPSVDGTKEFFTDGTEDSVQLVRSVSVNGNTLTVVVPRSVGYQQTFGLNAYEQASGGAPENTNWDTEGFDYSDTDETVHLSPDYTDHLGTEATVSPSGTQEYNVGVFLDSDTNPDDSFDLNVGVDPVTAGQ